MLRDPQCQIQAGAVLAALQVADGLVVHPEGRQAGGERSWRREIPRSALAGAYRFHVLANRYEVTSELFAVTPTTALTARAESAGPGRAVVTLAR